MGEANDADGESEIGLIRRELGTEVLCDTEFTRPERTVFAGEIRRRMSHQRPPYWYGNFIALIRTTVGPDLYEVVKALEDHSDLDWNAN